MESENREAVAAASDELSRTMNEHVPANRRPEDVMAEMVERVLNPRVTMRDHGDDVGESPERLMSGFQPLTPPESVAE